MEQKRLDKKNLIVLAGVVLLIALVAVIAAMQKRELNPTLGALEADATATPVVTQAPEAATAAPDTTESPAAAQATQEPSVEPAKAYLLVTVAGAMYEPIPLYEEGRYSVRRGDMVNVIEVTPDSVRMHESSCDNQDCVQQGEVHVDTYMDRILGTYVICLPNNVSVEMVPVE